MTGVTLRYKKPNWREWSFWHCVDRAEADTVRRSLKAEGYQVEG